MAIYLLRSRKETKLHIWASEWMFDAILSPVTGGSDPVLGCLPALKEFDLDLSRWEWIERSDIKETIS